MDKPLPPTPPPMRATEDAALFVNPSPGLARRLAATRGVSGVTVGVAGASLPPPPPPHPSRPGVPPRPVGRL